MNTNEPTPNEPTRTDIDAPEPPLSALGWLTVAVAVLAVVALLVGGGYVINRSLSGDAGAVAGSAAPAAADPAGTVPDGDDGGSNDLGGSGLGDSALGGGDLGATVPVTPTAVLPTCTVLPPAIDSAGRPHAYEAQNTIDGDVSTAWRCTGTSGQTLAVSFPCTVALATVGIDPGHDKTDPDGSDRFAQNRKVTRVKWTFDDGTTVEQQLEPRRGIQTMPVNQRARTATLTVLDTVDGQPVTNRAGQASAPFNDVTSISEVRFAAHATASGDAC